MLSIVIPTLNEAETLPHTVRRAREVAIASLEILLCDCGSGDRTLSVARELRVDHITNGAVCRADALNRAAALARGQTLLFLHADSILPPGYDEKIQRVLRQRPDLVGGAFDFEFGPRPRAQPFASHCLSWVVLCNRIRFRWTGNFYGDQSIFVRREVFQRMGGFPRVRLMEDIRFCARMRRFGRTAILRPPVITSPRRFLARGVIRQFAQDLALLGCESVGVHPQRLWAKYNQLNADAHVKLPSDDRTHAGCAAYYF